MKLELPRLYYSKLQTIGTLKVIALLFLALLTILFLVARNRVDRYSTRLADSLQTFYSEGLQVELVLNETLPLKIDLPIGELFDINALFGGEIPVSASVPISTSVRINQVIQVPVRLPVGGTVNVEVPINATVPIEQTIPIDTVIKLDPAAFGGTDQVITINRDVAVSIPLNLVIYPENLGLDQEFESIAGLINTLRLLFLLGRTTGFGG